MEKKEEKKKKALEEEMLDEVNGGKSKLPPDEAFWVRNNPLNKTK